VAASQHDVPLFSRPAWVEVDLDAVRRNLDRVRREVEPAAVLAVVKADAYGHGAVAVARTLVEARVDWLAVALVAEGLELRSAGIEAPILMLGPAPEEEIPNLLANQIVPAISSFTQLEAWIKRLEADPARGTTAVHLKVETGMHRLGLPASEWEAAFERIAGHPLLSLGGVLSHFADTQMPDSTYNRRQEERFAEALALAHERFDNDFLTHLANSGAALHRPESRHSIVRSGLALLGLDPTGLNQDLEAAMAVRGRIVHRLALETGQRVGYDGEWVAGRPSRLGIVQVGYADGYNWRLGNRAEALIGGTRAAVVGAISMDMLAIDLTDLNADTGTIVTLLGSDGDDVIAAPELARRAGISSYELLCHFGLRLPKTYLQSETRGTLSKREPGPASTPR
jgi:alanine racemase